MNKALLQRALAELEDTRGLKELRDAIQDEIDAPEVEPVASVIDACEYDEVGNPLNRHEIGYVISEIDALPLGTKLYTEPPDVAALRAELERVNGELEKWRCTNKIDELYRQVDAMALNDARYRWLQGHTIATGLSRWVGRRIFLDEAVDKAIASDTVIQELINPSQPKASAGLACNNCGKWAESCGCVIPGQGEQNAK